MKVIDFIFKLFHFVGCMVFTTIAVNLLINPIEDTQFAFVLVLLFSVLAGSLFVLAIKPIPVPKQDLLSILKTNGTGVLRGICRPNDKKKSLKWLCQDNHNSDDILLDFSLDGFTSSSYRFDFYGGDGPSDDLWKNYYGALVLPDSVKFAVLIEIKDEGFNEEVLTFSAILSPRN